MEKHTGAHIRLTDTLAKVLQRALDLEIPYFQTFLVTSEGKRYTMTADEIQEFRNQFQLHNLDAYVHLSYWINLAAKNNKSRHIIEREIKFAEKLGLNKVILHPGTATRFEERIEGMRELGGHLTHVLKKFPDVTIILENIAHGKKNIGGSIEDFAKLSDIIEHPDRIKFCIDTAHAFAFGYDLASASGQNAFCAEVGRFIGWDRVELIHLNDTNEECGSKVDKHEVPGEGLIGEAALKRFINLPHCVNKRIITEHPVLSLEEEREALLRINTWRKKA